MRFLSATRRMTVARCCGLAGGILLGVGATCSLPPVVGPEPAEIFSTLADFEEGILDNVEFIPADGGLRIAAEATTLPVIWVPNSNETTVSKVDTASGGELARYRVGPEGTHGDPSRTTMDLWGNAYVANRNTGTVVKMGFLEKNGCFDRNGNGTIETSSDVDGDGMITGDELLAWGQDECVLFEVVLATEDEGPFTPGAYPGPYPFGHWDPGTRSIALDRLNNVWLGVYGTRMFYYIDGDTGEILRKVDVSSVNHTPYGAVMDANGILWSSGQSQNHVLRLDPSDDSFEVVALPHFVYGLGIDDDNHLFVSGWTDSKLSRINILNGEIEWTHDGVYGSRGVAVTNDGDVWVADSSPGTVTRWSNDGEVKATIAVGNTPTGVAVDAEGKVWVVNNGDAYIKRIDPATNEIDLEKEIPGTFHYGYSDMTGIVGRGRIRIGNWTATFDAVEAATIWQSVAWDSRVPQGTTLEVRVRTSDDEVDWSDWLSLEQDADLDTLQASRFIQLEVTMQILSGDESPLLYSLSVFTDQ